jgi:pantetheine-phosphate adenylyltransferase
MAGLCVYAGSFDPPTNGHVWMIRQGAALFDRLVVAIGENVEKQYTFPLEQRLRWLREICAEHGNVEVTHFENLFLARYAQSVGARSILRGIRNEADYTYERTMRYINSDLHPDLKTIFMMPPRELCETSSSAIKAMIGPEGWRDVVRAYVPVCVMRDLEG